MTNAVINGMLDAGSSQFIKRSIGSLFGRKLLPLVACLMCASLAQAVSPLASNYVQDHLIAHWDAIENAGPGLHSTTVTTWANLVSADDFPAVFTAGKTPSWKDRMWSSGGGCFTVGTASDGRSICAAMGSTYTVEIEYVAPSSFSAGWGLFGNLSDEAGNSIQILQRDSGNANLKFGCTAGGQIYQLGASSFHSGAGPCLLSFFASPTLYRLCLDNEPYTGGATKTPTTATDSTLGKSCLYIGGTKSGQALQGSVHAVRIYDRALSPEESRRNYVLDEARFHSSDGKTFSRADLRTAADGKVECRIAIAALVEDAEFSVDGGASWLQTADFWVPIDACLTLKARTKTDGLVFNWIDLPSDATCSASGDEVSFRVNLGACIALDAFRPTHVWAGAVSSSFSTKGNWKTADGDDVEDAPGVDSDVYIPSGSVSATEIDVASLRIGGGDSTATLTFSSLGTNHVSGMVVVYPDGVLTHAANGSGKTAVEAHKLILEVDGQMWVSAGGKLDVSNKGFGKGAGRSVGTGGTYPSYGGEGSNVNASDGASACYGSIRKPFDLGTGGPSYGSGGAVRLDVGGRLTVNGSILALPCQASATGTGGSIWIDARTFDGSGLLDVGTGYVNGPTGGPGRIAVRLHAPGACFDGFTGAIRAFGTSTSISRRSAAGTVYLQTGDQEEGDGTLIIDNGLVSVNVCTIIGSQVEDAEVGEVIIRNSAKLQVASGCELRVRRGWHNESGTFVTAADSQVSFVGTNDFHMSGSSAFNSLVCDEPGKRIWFGTGSDDLLEISAGGSFAFRGTEEEPIWLLPETADGQWNARFGTGTVADALYLALSNSVLTADDKVVDYGGTDLGGNGDKWVFMGFIRPGEDVCWTGAADSDWQNPANWNPARVVVDTDNVHISASANHMPVISTGMPILHSVDIEKGAVLTVSGTTVTVIDGLTVGGTIALDGAEVVLLGDLSVSAGGKLTCGGYGRVECQGNISFAEAACLEGESCEFLLAAPEACTVNFAGATLDRLFVTPTAGDITFADGFVSREFKVDAGTVARTMTFAAERTARTRDLLLKGVIGVDPGLVLQSSVPGVPWSLEVTGVSYVRGVEVADSAATGPGGSSLLAFAPSTDGQRNSGWTFGASGAEWIGASGSSFHTASCWSSGAVPDANTHVLIESETEMSVIAGSPISVASLTLGGKGHVTLDVSSSVTVGDDLEVLTNGTLKVARAVTVGGSFVLQAGAVVAQRPGGKTDTGESVDVTAANITVGAGAKINVIACGYSSGKGPSVRAHGGVSEYTTTTYDCYGSIAFPTNWGSGGAVGPGGGRVRLATPGVLSLDGEILGTGSDGAGGSVLIFAGKMTGQGLIDVSGFSHTEPMTLCSGAGRVAIHLTGEGSVRGDFGGKILANGATDLVRKAGAGTIYWQEPGDRYATVLVDGGGVIGNVTQIGIPPSMMGDPPAALRRFSLIVRNGAKVTILGSMELRDLDLADATSVLNLGTNTLRITGTAHYKGKGWDPDATVNVSTVGDVTGRIDWRKPGLMISVR